MSNREIKYRCWDKKMTNPFEMSKPFNPFFYYDVFTANAVFMQYTGLTDINGIEICEGDICVRPYFNNETTIGVIEYKNGAFVFVSKEDPKLQVVGWSLLQPEKTEVLGNIYENNELIKNK